MMSMIFLGDYPLETDSGIRSVRYREVIDVPVVRATGTGAARFTTVLAVGPADATLVSRSTSGFKILITHNDQEWLVSVRDAVTADGLTIEQRQ